MEKFEYLKSLYAEGVNYADVETDQKRGKPEPEEQKFYPTEAELVDLVLQNDFKVNSISLFDAIKNRKTVRKFSDDSLTLAELSFLLWATQGQRSNKVSHRRNVPSAGARHPIETYLAVKNVKELKPGLYRYLPLEHKLYCLISDETIQDKIKTIIPAFNPIFPAIEKSAVTFIWTAIPYRVEWRYPGMSGKVLAQEVGHICQNLYLAVEAIDAGACAINAYYQERSDKFLHVDGKNEFVIYMAMVGKK